MNNPYTDLYNKVKNSTSNYSTYIDSCDVAKLIRFELDKKFPNQKFSVKTKKYSGGSSIDVSWIDGPTTKEVDSIVNLFSGASFDGMIDMQVQHSHYLTPSGLVYGGTSGSTGSMGTIEPISNSCPKNGIKVSLGSNYIFTNRHYNEETEKAAFDYCLGYYIVCDGMQYEDYKNGRTNWEQSRTIREYLESISFCKKETKKEEKPVEAKQEDVKIECVSNLSVTVKYDRDWTWITFSSKPSEEIRKILNSNGAKFSGKRVAWWFTRHVEQSELDVMLSSVKTESKNVTENNLEEKTEKIMSEKVAKNNHIEKADKLQKIADNMQETIDSKLNPACGNQDYTNRRARMAASMMEDGYRLEKVQSFLYALSEAHRSDNINPLLEELNSRAIVEDFSMFEEFPHKYYEKSINRLRKAGINELNYKETRQALMSITDVKNHEEEKRKRELENKAKSLIGQIPGYFPTPHSLAAEIVEKADIQENHKVLEPSAGSGNLAEAIKDNCPAAEVDTIEYNYALCELLEVKGFKVIANDFMTYSNGKRFDRIVMNPPFENGQDIEHVKHAYELLGENGRLVSIMSTGAFFRNDRKAVEFREWFNDVSGYQEDLPAGSFKDSLTGVNSCYVVIDR
jgi:phospholipid N-methyltransferase